MTVARCSELDRGFACHLSLLPIGNPYNPTSSEAIEGRAKHEALSHLPQGAVPPLEEIADRYGVDTDELRRAVAAGRRALDDLAPYLRLGEGQVFVEVRLESDICRGTGDLVVAVYEAEVLVALIVLDWKTGWGQDRHPQQLRGYAHCAVQRFGWPSSGIVTLFEVWTAHRQTLTTNLDRRQLTAFAGELAQILEMAGHSPGRLRANPGDHCKWCPRRVDCPDRDRWLRESVTALAEIDASEPITPEVIGGVYEQVQAVKRTVALYEKILRLAVEDGPVPLPDGRRLELVGTPREKISAAPAARLLAERLGRDRIDDLMGDLSKTSLERIAKLVSPPRKGAATLRTWLGMLRDSGAVREEIEYRKTVLDADPGEPAS